MERNLPLKRALHNRESSGATLLDDFSRRARPGSLTITVGCLLSSG
jgi:hypothetical protein